jgi:hypothetical protein
MKFKRGLILMLCKNMLNHNEILMKIKCFYVTRKWFEFQLFSKRPKTIFVLRKNKLYHKDNRMKIADFYVA